MVLRRKLLLTALWVGIAVQVIAQRTYRADSELSTGNWFKISVTETGIHRMDVAFLNSLGITGNIPSSAVRLLGNGGAMLPEAANGPRIDDLVENAIWVEDGGDGMLNGADYILFFARGPHHWIVDSINRGFSHRKNLYSDKTFYFITLGTNGLRIQQPPVVSSPAGNVSSYDEHYYHELDTVNFLSSGKQWYGEEFSGLPGRTLSRTFKLPLTDLMPQQARLVTSVAARSVSTPSSFRISINNQQVQSVSISPIGTGIYDVFARQVQQSDNLVLNAGEANLGFTYSEGSFNSQGWLDWFEFFARRELRLTPGKQLFFRDWNSTGWLAAQFLVSGAPAHSQVWDITNIFRPVKMTTTNSGNVLSFTNESQRLREYAAFSGDFLIPKSEGRCNNQNLHQTSETDFFIITAPEFVSQVQRLAQFHRDRHQLRTLVVTTEQVFNEFSGGTPDPTAIRDFIKMYFDRYHSTWASGGKYLLLFGKASFDYKNRISNNTNRVAAWESVNSLDPLATYTSDDFFGFLDDQEDINSGSGLNLLDIGTGRIPANTVEEAKNFVDKVLDYHAPGSYGPWRNHLNLVADDEDNNLHLQDAEVLAGTVAVTAPGLNQQKIYLDAFRQETASAGGRYPQANAMVNSNIYNGTLIWNYSGHGGPLRLAEEVVMDQQIVNNWSNRFRLPLFVTATCDFAPFDHPLQSSLGENLLVRPKTGAIALMTTTRLVFAYSNRILNNNYLRIALQPTAGRYKTLGEAVLAAKNYTYQTGGDIVNNRKFALLGDPAMSLGFPINGTRITKINGKDTGSVTDTLNAAEAVVMEGEVHDVSGAVMPDFQGTAYLTLFDKPRATTTLANDPTSQPVSFQEQQNILFRGKASVQNGKFSFRFRLPKDINYQFGPGKISLYAHDAAGDANGYSNDLVIGGIAPTASNDNAGPEIKGYLNDNKFVNGGITNSNPVLVLQLADSSGINTGSSGIDHDIVATLDNDKEQYFILNNFYESELDNYQRGTVRFQLPSLSPGIHSLKIKAWDVMNNSSEYVLEFTVVDQAELRISHVLNYPNPFTSRTFFWFEHNQPAQDLQVKIEVFSVSGRLIKTLSQTINTPGNRSNEVEWDGKDDYGQKIGRGVYIYRIRVKTIDGKTAQKWERLVILDK